nr:ECF transporter S component [Feifania hominis]
MVVTGLMAAMIFVVTMFLKIEIPTPTGPTMLKIGNIICLTTGLLFGGVTGGLAAGIGSALFDLCHPAYAAEFYITFINFFMMGFVCGLVSHLRGQRGKNFALNCGAAAAGALTYFVLHIGKNVLVLVLSGSNFQAALLANTTKMITSGVNAAIAVIAAVLITPALRPLLERAGVYRKLEG